jgi:metallo-beta-lactamase class B
MHDVDRAGDRRRHDLRCGFCGRHLDHPTYQGIADDYKKTFQTLRSLKCDVFLGAHGGYYDMIEKYRRMQNTVQPNPFIDPEGYRASVDSEEAHFLEQLSREKVRRHS